MSMVAPSLHRTPRKEGRLSLSAYPHISPETDAPERILIVDDEDLIVLAMRRYFEGLGYAVDSAFELEEAQALLATYQYDLVIADLRLTGIGGVEGLQIVSDVHNRCTNTRVILLSAFGTPEIERESYNRGADAFLHKPKAMMEIASIARTLLEY
jgi:DNA-binding response OmpR family regulator